MKLLLDSCVWGKALPELLASGHDAIWAGDWDEDPGDREILLRAHRDRRVLVTLDKDFGTLAVFSGQPHSGILRLVGISAKQQAAVVIRVVEGYSEELLGGAIITVGSGRIRIRPSE